MQKSRVAFDDPPLLRKENPHEFTRGVTGSTRNEENDDLQLNVSQMIGDSSPKLMSSLRAMNNDDVGLPDNESSPQFGSDFGIWPVPLVHL